MTELRSRCASTINLLKTAIDDQQNQAQKLLDEAYAQLQRTPNVAPVTTEDLLSELLKPARERVNHAKNQLTQASQENLLRRLFLVPSARRNLAAEELELKGEIERANRKDEITRRASESRESIEKHEAYVEAKRIFENARSSQSSVGQHAFDLFERHRPIRDAVKRGAWLAPETDALLNIIVEHVRHGKWVEAIFFTGKLSFQKLPSDEKLTAWAEDSQRFLNHAESMRSGFSAVAPFQGLVDPSLELAERHCQKQDWQENMEDLQHWADRWHALPRACANPRSLIHPLQWILYWTFFTENQAFTEDLNQARGHEDYFTGHLMGLLSKRLRGWGKGHLQELGYPRATTEFGLLRMAGLDGEALTGGDIGLIAHLQVGDLHAHKVAILQAKISANGKANIGSKPSGSERLTQLQKLRVPERDFFLFYHTAVRATPSILPTVTPVTHFLHAYDLTESSLSRQHITVETREMGWDLASFFAFGLCTPGNSLGLDVPFDQNPLEILTSGGSMSLPEYVVVVSLSDDEHDYDHVLSTLNKSKYVDKQIQKSRSIRVEKGKDGPSYDGPGL